ncbi:MAG TPA: protein translocase subunit SecF [Gammaproteobacteria bacterium]|nr:protein translocase subunit SecF [Gammaproteobacteria bacterium]
MHWQWLTGSGTPNFNFVKYRRVAMMTSAILSFVAIVSFFYPGLNYGIDFTGGTIVEAAYTNPPDLDAIRGDLTEAGFESVQAQNFGSANDVLIRLPPAEGEDASDPAAVTALQNRVQDVLRAHDADVEIRSTATVGGQVGEDLFENAGLALLFALILVFAYVMLRFRWKLAVGAIVATLHDVIVTSGIFALAGWQFDLTVLGSILAVLGYSLNDTIVVYDRIRDNFRLMRRGSALEIVNASVNQTLARTLVTGVTSLLVLFALMLLGGDTLWGFSVALIIGIVVGTYSSIYIASSMALALDISPSDFTVTKQERVDELP